MDPELFVGVTRASLDGHPLPLTPSQLDVLRVLAEARGRPVSRRELARRAALAGSDPRRAEAHLVSLRRLLPPDSIRTVPRRGWALALDVA